MIASPLPQTAVNRRKGLTMTGFTTTIGAITGPDFEGATVGAGLLGAGGVLEDFGDAFGAGSGFGAGAGGNSGKYLSGKSVTISPLSETRACKVKEASRGIFKITSPPIVVNPYCPVFASGPIIVMVPFTVLAASF